MNPRDTIYAYPWSAFGSVDYRLVLEFFRFDGRPGESIQLEARWAIMTENGHQAIVGKYTKIEQPMDGTTYADMVNAQSKALDKFSRVLSKTFQALRKDMK